MSNEQSWKKVFSSAIVALEATLAPPPGYRFSKQSIRALKPFLPYCLHEAGGGNFIWLNRDYKPCGIATDEFVDYAEYPWVHVRKDEPVAIRGSFWLFGDLNPPWFSKKDAARLARVMKLILDPGLNLRDTKGQAFGLLAEDWSNSKWGCTPRQEKGPGSYPGGIVTAWRP
ncbi:MAG: hypothetical protein ACWGKN_09445 [Desulfoprunum sp.]